MEEVRVVKYEKKRFEEWNSFLKSAKNSLFMFNRNYMDYHSNRFLDHSLLFYHKKKLLAVMPCSEHNGELRSHGGLTYGGLVSNIQMRQKLMIACFCALENYCNQTAIDSILYKTIPSIYHCQPAEEDVYALYFFGAKIEKVEASTVINLHNPLKMSKLRRRQINKAKNADIEVLIDDNREAYNAFLNLQDNILVERHNVNAVHTGAEMYMLHERFPNNIHLYKAIRNGDLLGGSIIFVYNDVVHTQYLCANNEAKDLGALDLVVSKIMEDYENRAKWIDFGISTESGGRYLNEGLINQKEGFGGRTVVYTTWRIDFKKKKSERGDKCAQH